MVQPTHEDHPSVEPSDSAPAEPPKSLEDVEQSPEAPGGWHGAVVNTIVPLLMVIAAVAIGGALITSPPHVAKSNPQSLAPVVGVAELVPHDADVFVEAFGTVVPSREIRIIPEVTGRIVEINDHLEPGGIVAAGELLFKIDPADYEIAVAQAEADLEVARREAARMSARIEVLQGRLKQLDVEVAYLRWNANRLGRLTEDNSAAEIEARNATMQLESQRAAQQSVEAEIAEQQASVESAEAGIQVAERRLESARLALARTAVQAPFDAIVVSENVEKGQRVGPQNAIATLAATDEFWAEAAVPVARLGDIRFALEHEDDPSKVLVRLATGAESIVRHGVALRPLGDLDPLGRMAQVLIVIQDPLGLAGDDGEAARRVLLGSYVRLRIESGRLHDVYSISRKALRENDCIWVRDAEGKLAIRPVKIVWRRHEDVLVRNGFEAGDQLVMTHLASVVPGLPLRVRDGSRQGEDAGSAATTP